MASVVQVVHCWSLYQHIQVTPEEEVEVVGEEGEAANFAGRLEVWHVLMAPKEIPKGVVEEDIGMGENAVGVVEGLGN